MNELMQEYEEISTKYPHLKDYMMKMFIIHMPEVAKETLEEFENIQEYGYHIITPEMYQKYIKKLPMAKWEHETIKTLAKINFEDKEYYSYDFAFLMNYLFCLFGEFMADASYYLKMTQSLLENKMIENADDMAFHIAKKIKVK